MNDTEPYNVDLIMLSNFGRTDGGRETWAYNLIPLWLQSDMSLNLSIYGLTPHEARDNSGEMLKAVDAESRSRLRMHCFPAKWPKLPLFFSMFFQFLRHSRRTVTEAPHLVLGVGGLFEMLMLLGAAGKYWNSNRVLWMRGIFCNEKADRLPSFLLPLLRKFEVYCLKKADLLIANGDDIAAHYAEYGLQVHVIKNGVDMKKWAMPKPALAPPIKVAYVGRLAKVKGIEYFLDMIRSMKKEHRSAFEFHIVGDGPYADAALDLARQGALSYHGAIDSSDLPRALGRFDVCVALTLASATCGGGGTSNAMLEQMAAGRVVVAWDNVIFRQLLDQQNAYLVPQGDISELAKALIEIASDKETACAKAEAAKGYVAGFSLETQIVKFNQVTGRQVLSEGGNESASLQLT